MRLTIVGCTGSMSGPAAAASCYLVQYHHQGRQWSIVLDLGPGSFGQLWRYLNPATVDAIIASHYHADHFADIISMQVFRRWNPSGPLPPLPLYGPAGGHERIAQIEGEDPAAVDYSKEFAIHRIQGGQAIELGPFTIEFHPTWHPVESYAVRISAGGKTLCYSGDTDACPGLLSAAAGVDLFLSECGFTEAEADVRGIHLTGRRLAEVALTAGVKSVLITHIQPWTDPGVVIGQFQAEQARISSGPTPAASLAQSLPVAIAKPGVSYEI